MCRAVDLVLWRLFSRSTPNVATFHCFDRAGKGHNNIVGRLWRFGVVCFGQVVSCKFRVPIIWSDKILTMSSGFKPTVVPRNNHSVRPCSSLREHDGRPTCIQVFTLTVSNVAMCHKQIQDVALLGLISQKNTYSCRLHTLVSHTFLRSADIKCPPRLLSMSVQHELR